MIAAPVASVASLKGGRAGRPFDMEWEIVRNYTMQTRAAASYRVDAS